VLILKISSSISEAIFAGENGFFLKRRRTEMKKIQEHLGLVFLIIIAIFAVAIGGYFTLRKGVFIGDDFYYKVRADKFVHNTVNYVERTKDDTFLLVADGKKQNVSYTMKGDQVTFSFADDTINGIWTGDQLLAADGSPVGWDEMQIIAGNEKPVISDETYSNALGHILYGNLESISFWGFTVLGVLIYVLGIVQIYYPDKVYFFLRRWQFQNAELSDEGRTVTVIGGMIICIIGIGVMSGLILYLIK
jgi:uncharacterized protein YxeA